MDQGARGLGEPFLGNGPSQAGAEGAGGGGRPPLPPAREAGAEGAGGGGRPPLPPAREAAAESNGGSERRILLPLEATSGRQALGLVEQAGAGLQWVQYAGEAPNVDCRADMPRPVRRTSLRNGSRNVTPTSGVGLSPKAASSSGSWVEEEGAEARDVVDMVHCVHCQEEFHPPLPRRCPNCNKRVTRGKLPEGQSLRKLLDEVLVCLNVTDDNDLQELRQESLIKIQARVQEFCKQVLSEHADAIKMKASALQLRVEGSAAMRAPSFGALSQEGEALFDISSSLRSGSFKPLGKSLSDQLRQVQKFLVSYLQCISCSLPEPEVPEEMEFVHCSDCQREWAFPGGPIECTICNKRGKNGHLPQVRKVREDLIAEVRALKALLFAAEEGTLSVAWSGWLPVPSWPNLLYVLQTYSLMMALVMCVALFLGSMMGIFLFVMSNIDDEAPSDAHPKRLSAVFLTFLLPILIFMGSLFIFNCGCLLAGQTSSVSFPRCRALMLVALLKNQALKTSWNDGSLDYQYDICKSECWYVDMWFVWLYLSILAFWSLAATLYTLMCSSGKITYLFSLLFKLATDVWGVAMLWTFIWGLLTMVLYIGCDIYVGLNEELRCAVNAAQMALQKYDVRPGDMGKKSRVILNWLHHDSQLTLQKETLKWKIKLNRREMIPICLCGFFLALFAVLALVHRLRIFGAQTNDVKMVMSSIWILLCVLCISRASWRSFPKMLSCPFFMSVGLLAVFIDGVLYCALNLGPLSHGLPIPVPLSNHTPGAWVYENLDSGTISKNGKHPPYPSCYMRWGANHELKILDLAILSSYSYDPDDGSYLEGGQVWNHTQVSFTGQGIKAEILFAQDFWTVGRVVVFRFATEGSDKGTVVLVVKGSSEAFDFYADAGLWTSIAGFQVFMVLVPLLDQLPNWVFAGILEWLPRTRMEKHIFSNIHDIFHNLTHEPRYARYARDTFLITGHSLGGGIATAAGGSLGIPAVSFSGPGSHFSRWRFGTSEEKAYRSALTVKPEIDIVHKFDRHDELGQYIECKDPLGHYRDAATCHMIGTTTCELWRACGDHRGRDFREMCEQLLGDMSKNGKYLTGD